MEQPKIELDLSIVEVQNLVTRLTKLDCPIETWEYIRDLIKATKYNDALNAIEELESQTEA